MDDIESNFFGEYLGLRFKLLQRRARAFRGLVAKCLGEFFLAWGLGFRALVLDQGLGFRLLGTLVYKQI